MVTIAGRKRVGQPEASSGTGDGEEQVGDRTTIDGTTASVVTRSRAAV
jgi:hypothetical protein